MAKIVFDVETVGQDFSSLDETSQEYFLRFAETEQEKEDARNSLSFYPLTAQVITIGMLEVETDRGFVYFQNPGGAQERFKEGNAEFVCGDEKMILTHFWEKIKGYPQFVTFNGRVFDCPFLMLRSAINHVQPAKNLVPYRYNHTVHIDLADQLSFYDALRRKFSLHMWCKAFDIPSPKEQGITGLQVKEFFAQGRHTDIARYCLKDIQATKALYLYWEKYLRF